MEWTDKKPYWGTFFVFSTVGRIRYLEVASSCGFVETNKKQIWTVKPSLSYSFLFEYMRRSRDSLCLFLLQQKMINLVLQQVGLIWMKIAIMNSKSRWWNFKYFICCSSLFGEDEPNLTSMFFRMGGKKHEKTTNQMNSTHPHPCTPLQVVYLAMVLLV